MTTLNLFAETELLETVQDVTSDNPYAPPADTRNGVWDHTLFWRLMKITGCFVLFLMAIDVFLLTKYRQSVNPNLTFQSVLDGFVTGITPGNSFE